MTADRPVIGATATMCRDALIAGARQAAGDVFPGTGIFLAYAFGSRVAGHPRPDSDLDVGYYLETYLAGDRLPIKEEMLLCGRLSDAVGCEVDLRDLGPAPLEVRGRVLEEGVRIYCSDETRRVNLERDLLGRYHDYKPSFAAMRALRLAAFARKG